MEGAELSALHELENGFLVATSSFLFCYCKIHNKLSKNQDFINNNLIYVFQSFLIDFGPNSCSKLFYFSSNQNASFLTITSALESEVENYTLQVYQLDNSQPPFNKFFSIGLHSSKIERISAARSKTLFVTLGEGEARIWSSNNEADLQNFKLIKSQHEDEFYVDVAIHPFGFQLALAMFTGFKVFLILDDKLQLAKEVDLVWCSIISYSSRGRYLVANEKNNLCVFDTIHYNLVFIFKLHQRLIKRFLILDDQFTIISYCNNGDLIMWTVLDKAKIIEKVEHEKKETLEIYKHQCSHYESFVYNQQLQFFIGINQDNQIVLYTNKCIQLSMVYNDESCQFLSLETDDKAGLLFVGTNRGSVRLYFQQTWQFAPNELLETSELLFQEVRLSSLPIVNLQLIERGGKLVIAE